MEARITHRDAQPVQSGPAQLEQWLVEFAPETPPDIDPLMGWVSSTDVKQQVRMAFPSQAEAEAYCRRHGVEYVVRPQIRHVRRRTYADNFREWPDGVPVR